MSKNYTAKSPQIQNESITFLQDVLTGLSRNHKELPSKYFYDRRGDVLFQKLMENPAYYLTNCELEIFKSQTGDLVKSILQVGDDFDLIELGAGDATKSIYVLQELISQGITYHYIPVDISDNIIQHLSQELPLAVQGIRMSGFKGDYFDMLQAISRQTNKPKAVLFLGSNIGNMSHQKALNFLEKLRGFLNKGDIAIIGFDLKKHPSIIRRAYDDPDGITAAFNLNLLSRINQELGGNFQIEQFDHYCSYDPASGACKSYLISLIQMNVSIGQTTFAFRKNEYIWMEISQKYSNEEINEMAHLTGFSPLRQFTDQKQWFIDAVWQAE